MSLFIDVDNLEHLAAVRDVCDTILTVCDIFGPSDDRTYEQLRRAMSTDLKRDALAQVWLPEDAVLLMRALAERLGVEVLQHDTMPGPTPDEPHWPHLLIADRLGPPLHCAWAMKVVPLVILDLLAATDKTSAICALRRKW